MKGSSISINALFVGSLLFAIIIADFAIASASTTQATAAPAVTPTLSLSFAPADIEEGDPVMITINGTSTTANIQGATLRAPGPNIAGGDATATLYFMKYKNMPTAFYGTGINQRPGTTTVIVTLKDGSQFSSSFFLAKRIRPAEYFPVPAQIGGNSTSSQERLVANLEAQNDILATAYSNPKMAFWTTPFIFPLAPPIVITDAFGYNRESGAETIIHKGTDFKAAFGTPIYAINDGIVRMTKFFSVYGNTVIIDHGLGIESMYMHLSKMTVKPGQTVVKGQIIGYTGDVGYATGPHLHLTIRIGGISIDPMAFYAFFGVTQ